MSVNEKFYVAMALIVFGISGILGIYSFSVTLNEMGHRPYTSDEIQDFSKQSGECVAWNLKRLSAAGIEINPLALNAIRSDCKRKFRK